MSTIIVTTDLRKKSCCSIKLSFQQCCRGNYINTGARSQQFYVEATLNICVADPGFVDWDDREAKVICLGRDFIGEYSINTGNKNDSIVYSFADPMTSATVRSTWSSGYSSDKPVYFLGFPKAQLPFPRGFRIDSFSGELKFRPMREEATILAVKASIYRKGILVGATNSDRPIVVMSCPSNNPPYISGINYSSPHDSNFDTTVCAGTEVCFRMAAADKDNGDTASLSVQTALEGVRITRLNPGGMEDSIQFCWTPAVDDTRDQPYYVTFTAKDNNCPINGIGSRRFRIYVKPSPDFAVSHQIKNCGNVVFRAKKQNTQSTVSYSWSYGNQTIKRVTTSPPDSQRFSILASGKQVVDLHIKGKNGCVRQLTDTVILPKNFIQAKRTPDTMVCEGSTISPKANVLYPTGKFKVKWSTGDSSTSSTSTTTFKAGVKDTFVVLSLKDAICTKTDTIRISVNPLPKVDLPRHVYACFGDIAIVQSSNPRSPSITSYSWYYKQQALSTFDNSTHLKTSESGTFRLVTKDAIGCFSEDSSIVTIKAPIDRGDFNRSACTDGLVTLRLPPTSNGFYSWFVGTTDTTQTPSYKMQDTIIGTFTMGQVIGVLLTDTLGGHVCQSLDSIKINKMFPPLKISITASTDSVCQKQPHRVRC